MRVERLDVDEWGDALPNDGFEVFHTPEALSVLEKHAGGELHMLGGFKGQQAIALLPAFVNERSVGTTVLSPPPGLGVPRLGPILMPTSPKRRKREKINQEFTEKALDELGVDRRLSTQLEEFGVDSSYTEKLERVGADPALTLFRMNTNVAYDDPRPYSWSDLAVETQFTYVLETEGTSADDLMSSFSKSLRREIRDGKDLDVEVSVEGIDGTRAVYEDTKARYEEQDRGFSMSWEYVRDLVEALGDRARTYVARDADGEYVSGITVLYSNDMGYYWQGGARAVHEGVSINSLVHWHILEDVIDDPPLGSVTQYDLMGANTQRLCRYKAKFGAELVPYYTVESATRSMDVAKRAYQLINGRRAR